ncbi:hypothetical protein PSDVSF_25810 [Pseudodesulfovibrio sediminis]|uniref:Uncharacterized protein n=1 Tax=Pseudodesulfovibrio sediminis TaxID=2810563 RepID=A0ABM7P8L2_9BACT|nr:hypothetical protein PSDVSF_25810 [Pseudodesulfovibrio sediminis]
MRLFLLLKKRPPPAKGMEQVGCGTHPRVALAPQVRIFILHSRQERHPLPLKGPLLEAPLDLTQKDRQTTPHE